MNRHVYFRQQEKNYLAHHGIKGQKWGIRRYQNEDGSLTPEGEKRYGYDSEGLRRRYADALKTARKEAKASERWKTYGHTKYRMEDSLDPAVRRAYGKTKYKHEYELARAYFKGENSWDRNWTLPGSLVAAAEVNRILGELREDNDDWHEKAQEEARKRR